MPQDAPQPRTDSAEEKLKLLAAACSSGQQDLALSLAESLEDTLRLERLEGAARAAPSVPRDSARPVSELPAAWAAWARGWSHATPLALFETVGLQRRGEPVELAVSFPAEQAVDPVREVRVARVDPALALREVRCQVHGEARAGADRVCRVLFQADVPAHGRADYLVLHGNPLAELARPSTDLRCAGDGYALDVSNSFYAVRLSRQMGQIERLTLRREHELELYAGGKGHGEPPAIDWAHDYVDEGGFQKLRMRNWARCPNHETVRGPLCVRVRRWGFPHGPIHPVLAPSRLHIDVSYTFYSGLPYFLKEGRMEAVKDLETETVRDDEWVFSGYSFTDTLWVDRQGKVREGAVPAEQAGDLWGAGFFHRESRDAFVALWLEHSAEGCGEIQHCGAPTLSYPGHGQLWSRGPIARATLKAGASLRQKNAYVVLPYAGAESAAELEGLRHQLSNPLETRAVELPRIAGAQAEGSLARPGETAETAPLKPAVWRALREVKDEQLYKLEASIVDLGYVYDVRAQGGAVVVVVTMPHRGRPVHAFLETRGGGRVDEGIRERVLRIPGVTSVAVEPAWEPPWTPARLSEGARRDLGLPA
ncbi:MAG: hypothetical protein HY721_02970 [Planctomycetes bacterium]|nr:hypothetical protein [Planctomycetota bacterium]